MQPATRRPPPSATVFPTRSINLAAFLRAQGYPVRVGTHPDPSLVMFEVTVEGEGPTVAAFFALVGRFERGQAAVEPSAFDEAKRSLTRDLHDELARKAQRGGAR